MWPLNYYFFESWHLKNMLNGGGLGLFMLFSGLAMIFVVSPYFDLYVWKTMVLLLGVWLRCASRNSWRPFSTIIK